jgi:hypothetical protein
MAVRKPASLITPQAIEDVFRRAVTLALSPNVRDELQKSLDVNTSDFRD